MTRVYLDNAATSWPKPEAVYQAVEKSLRTGGAAGRGSYREVTEASRLVDQTRTRVAQFINAENSRNIVFTFSGTDGLSTAIFGLLKRGDHVITSVVEHNSVLRPLKILEQQGIEVTRVGCDHQARFSFEEIVSAVRTNTRLICLIHVSNVTGAIQPIREIHALCRDNDIFFLLDAAQSLGHIPVDVKELGCDLLAAPGHKGLLGPLGTGILYLNDQAAAEIKPLRAGGTGTLNGRDDQPDQLPDKFESGNLNVPGIAGLGAGLKFLESAEGKEQIAASHALTNKLVTGLQSINGVRVFGPEAGSNRSTVVSISIEGIDCHEAAHILDGNWSIQTRAGLHCAPLVHRALGTAEKGGLIRISTGLFNTEPQIDIVLDALAQIS